MCGFPESFSSIIQYKQNHHLFLNSSSVIPKLNKIDILGVDLSIEANGNIKK